MKLDDIKDKIVKRVEAQRQDLTALSLRIHDSPETGLKEFKASQWLTEYLEKNGFAMERGICQLPTAFRATYGSGKPRIGILAEYDALPGIGHGCGHNIIAGSAIGAGIAAQTAVDEYIGSIFVIGTPAEELIGGKVMMAERGAFADLDIAMMIHPGVRDVAITSALARVGLMVEFFGKEAHASARPEDGVNALEAMIQSFNNINSLRQHIRNQARIHGIITDGGTAANIVPAHSAGHFLVRAEDDKYLEELREKALNCFRAAALATGCRLEYRWTDTRYAALRTNLKLAETYAKNMEALGRRIFEPNLNRGMGSTDMGNVSAIVPSIHPSVAIAPSDVIGHSPEFAVAAASEEGMKGMIDSAKALAMTVADVLAQPNLLIEIKEEFAHNYQN